MSVTRKSIVLFARAQIYWYTHQHNIVAMNKVNRLEKLALRLVFHFGGDSERTALQQAYWKTVYITPAI